MAVEGIDPLFSSDHAAAIGVFYSIGYQGIENLLHRLVEVGARVSSDSGMKVSQNWEMA
jgi:hypothetical protein